MVYQNRKFKCHYCGKNLKPGGYYTLECECGNCRIGFDKHGKAEQFELALFEKGKDIIFRKDRYSNKITYGVGHGLVKPRLDKVVMQVEVELQFDEEGTPLVYTLWEKLNKLIVFS